MVLVAAHPAAQRRPVGRHDPANLVREVHRERGEDVVTGAAADQELGDHVLARVPAGRPADHLQGVVVAAPDDVPTRIGQPSHDFQVAARRGPVHGVGVVALLPEVGVQAALEQQVDARQVPLGRRHVQQRVLVGLGADLQLLRVPVEQRGQYDHLAVPRRVEQSVVNRQRIGRRLTGLVGHAASPITAGKRTRSSRTAGDRPAAGRRWDLGPGRRRSPRRAPFAS